jgi:hypothetical protein
VVPTDIRKLRPLPLDREPLARVAPAGCSLSRVQVYAARSFHLTSMKNPATNAMAVNAITVNSNARPSSRWTLDPWPNVRAQAFDAADPP